MHAYWFKMWSDLFENSFNYYYQYTYKLFNPDIRIGTDDDFVVMGDVTVVLPNAKLMDEKPREMIKDAIINALKPKYKRHKSMFQLKPEQRRRLKPL